MKNTKWSYAVCPHCEHPNIHVHSGKLAKHHVSLTGPLCLGSEIDAQDIRETPVERTSQEYQRLLQKAQTHVFTPPEVQARRPTFKTWRFSGVEFIAIPHDNNSDHIMDALGSNYGAWVDVNEFRKRQQAGNLSEWQALGRAHLQVVCERDR